MKRETQPCLLPREFPILANLESASRDALMAHAVTRTYERGDVLFDEGDACKGMFLICEGTVKIYRLSDTGREQILAILRDGDSVAELPLFDRKPYPASAAALAPTTVQFIPMEKFQAAMRNDPALAQGIISALSQRMRALVDLIADLSLRQVRERLARFLLEEAAGRREFRLALTNEELAARLGSVRDVVSRTLSGLHNDGLIQVRGRTVVLLDAEGLRRESGIL